MKIYTLICDDCKTKKNVESYKINEGTEMDCSGNGYNVNWRYIDLCDKCYWALVNNDLDIDIRNYEY